MRSSSGSFRSTACRQEYGLPEAIRSDNGTPFATQALCGLSRLSVWWLGRAVARPVRYLSRLGSIKWKRQQLFVSQALAHEWVGLEESADGVWDLYFYDRLLARLDERSGLRP